MATLVSNQFSTSTFTLGNIHRNVLFLLNGEPVSTVVPYRGIRQGCSQSPISSFLCAKGFSLNVSHLIFADDSILFGKAEMDTCMLLRKCYG